MEARYGDRDAQHPVEGMAQIDIAQTIKNQLGNKLATLHITSIAVCYNATCSLNSTIKDLELFLD